ncbi:sucrase ferredoxin [uncultured Phycicoccus sp.]|uniref:sucrase ferredoxin n=1 Tax=uncultured Phycicoccus sp. TaxID=661422 RepID=UPI002638663F|nr:sucrase ferredoxin [uncultured Phycicoccus sp.]
MALTDLSRCSAASRHRGDPLAGSAPVASRWLLIEHPGPWAKNPLDTPPLAGRTGEEVEATCASFGGRVLLIRRQGRREAEPGDQLWYAIDTVRGTWVRGTWRTAEDLLRAARSLGVELSSSDEDAEPMVLVCTQGTRDACCAVRGRPIVAKLVREWPDEVWECTHLGGHRFSGTLLSLPDGACYGYLDTEFASEVVRSHLAGTVTAKYLRGVTRWDPEVQAALAAVLVEHGPAGVDDAVPGRVEAGEDPATTRVEVIGSGQVPDRTLVDVRREELPEAALSCGGGPKAHVAYRTTVTVAP